MVPSGNAHYRSIRSRPSVSQLEGSTEPFGDILTEDGMQSPQLTIFLPGLPRLVALASPVRWEAHPVPPGEQAYQTSALANS